MFDFSVTTDFHFPRAASAQPEALDLRARRSAKCSCVSRPIFVGRMLSHGEECALVHVFHARRTSRIGAFRNHLAASHLPLHNKFLFGSVISITRRCGRHHGDMVSMVRFFS